MSNVIFEYAEYFVKSKKNIKEIKKISDNLNKVVDMF